jgi:hypothetical protein
MIEQRLPTRASEPPQCPAPLIPFVALHLLDVPHRQEYDCIASKSYTACQLREFRLSTHEPTVTNKLDLNRFPDIRWTGSGNSPKGQD